MANQVERINKLEKEAAEVSIRLKRLESQQQSRSTIRVVLVNAVVSYVAVLLILMAGEVVEVTTAVAISFIAPGSVILGRVVNVILKRYFS